MITQEEFNRRKDNDSIDYCENKYERRGNLYSTIKVDSISLSRIFHELRYSVYCEEHPEFDLKHKIDNTEYDTYDDNSSAFLLLYRPLHMFLGGVRLIYPKQDEPIAKLPFIHAIDNNIAEKILDNIDRCAEISRFLISNKRLHFLHKKCDFDQKFINRHYGSHIIHIFKEIFIEAYLNKIEYIYAILPKSFMHISNKEGLNWIPIGPEITHHGAKRFPAYVKTDSILDDFKKTNLKNYNFYNDNLKIHLEKLKLFQK